MLHFVKWLDKITYISSKVWSILSKTLLLLAVLFIIWGLIALQHWYKKRAVVAPGGSEGHDYKIVEKIYTPPIVKLPFTKDKQPIKDDMLPIPKESVLKTIGITVPAEKGEVKLELVVDKKGNVYKTKDFPEGVEVVVTKWQSKLIKFGITFSYSLACTFKGSFFHCLSVDVVRVGNLSLGVDAGLGVGQSYISGYLVGLSGKYKLLALSSHKTNFTLSGLFGRDFLHERFYAGLNLRF